MSIHQGLSSGNEEDVAQMTVKTSPLRKLPAAVLSVPSEGHPPGLSCKERQFLQITVITEEDSPEKDTFIL